MLETHRFCFVKFKCASQLLHCNNCIAIFMIFLYAKATRGSEKGIEAEPTVWEQVGFVETVSDILMSSPGRKGGRGGSGSSHRNCTGFLS